MLFRIFHYPPLPADAAPEPGWGVGEHTDYGLLTILVQDESGGLELRTHGEWVAVPAATRRARVQPRRHARADDRRPVPLDPAPRAQPARVGPDLLPVLLRSRLGRRGPRDRRAARRRTDDSADRWDGASVLDFDGTYGDYLLGKVSKVFPALREQALE